MTSNAGLIFSLCAGILIGLKLFYCMKKSDKQKKKKEKNRQKAKQKSQIDETIEFFRRKMENDQHKASLEMQEFLARQMLDLEKVKQISKERGYSSVTTNNDNVWQPTHDFDKALKYHNEAIRREKLLKICRDLWYGTCLEVHDKGHDDYFEEILKDPTTVVMERLDALPFEQRKIVVKSRGKTYEFSVDNIEMCKYF